MTRWDRDDPYPPHLLDALTLLGLTVSEAEVVALVGTGWSFSDVARERGCRQSSVYRVATNAAAKLRTGQADVRPIRRVLVGAVIQRSRVLMAEALGVTAAETDRPADM